MKWSSQFATGVPVIDEQHQQMFMWLEQLEEAALDQRMLVAVYSLSRLTQYARSHFAHEEALMMRTQFPGLEAHRAEHEIFRVRLRQLQAQAVAVDITEETVNLLREWLVGHIMGSDMEYVPYVKDAKPEETSTTE